jgi:type I restriction enzyme R subunit
MSFVTPNSEAAFEQVIEKYLLELQQAAKVNSPDKFTLLFNQIVKSLFIERVDQNEAIFARYAI